MDHPPRPPGPRGGDRQTRSAERARPLGNPFDPDDDDDEEEAAAARATTKAAAAASAASDDEDDDAQWQWPRVMTTFGEKLGGGDAMSKFRLQYNRGVPKAGACVGAALAGGCRLTDLNLGTTLDADDLHALVRGLAANSFLRRRASTLRAASAAPTRRSPASSSSSATMSSRSRASILGYNRLEGPATSGPRGRPLRRARRGARGNASLKELDLGSNLLQGAGVATICGALPGRRRRSRCSTSRSGAARRRRGRSRRTSRGRTAR